MKADNLLPQVSVIIPVYNAEQFICDALASVLNQNIPCEIILVDDCSPDNSIDRAVEFLKSSDFTEYKVISTKSNQGPGMARNTGVKNASHELIAFLDSDDIWADRKLEKQITELNRADCSLCCTGRELINADGSDSGIYIGVQDRISYSDLLKTNSISLSSVLIKKKIAEKYPFPNERNVHEDYICWLNILRERGNACGINEPLLLYRKSEGQKTGSKLKSAAMHYRSLRLAEINSLKSALLFVSYTFNGIKKHRGLK